MYCINGGPKYVEQILLHNCIAEGFPDRKLHFIVTLNTYTTQKTWFGKTKHIPEIRKIAIPLFLFTKEDGYFYEFFSQERFGKVAPSSLYSSVPVLGCLEKQIDYIQIYYNTYDDSYHTIQICPASEFLNCVTKVKQVLRAIGIDDQKLKELIKDEFLKSREATIQKEKKALDERAAQEQKERQAQLALEGMLEKS